jgi:DNA-binding transcriptional LysR family regulator
MSKAAALLNTTQSTISRSIAELEQTIGVRLLDRNAQGVEPTHYGHALLKRGIAAFDEIKQGIEDIRYLNDPGTGELHIGSSPSMAEGIVLAVIQKLSRQYPRVVFHLVPGGTLALYEELRQRRIELAFVTRTVPDEEDLNSDILFEEPLVIVAGIHNPWARRRKIKLAELVNEPWTWPAAGTAFDGRVIEAFRASGLEPPRAKVYAEALNMRIKLAAGGPFLAVVPGYISRFSAAYSSMKVLPVELPTSRRPSAIVTLKNRTLSPLAQRFIDCARELAKPLMKRQTNGRNRLA